MAKEDIEVINMAIQMLKENNIWVAFFVLVKRLVKRVKNVGLCVNLLVYTELSYNYN